MIKPFFHYFMLSVSVCYGPHPKNEKNEAKIAFIAVRG